MKNKTVKEIFKFQRPLNGGREVLIYNKDRSIEVIDTLTKRQIKDLFWEDEYKVYCLCSYTPPRSYITVEQIVEEQDW